MKVSLLYKVFFIGIVTVICVIGILWKVEHSLLPSEMNAETPPAQSGLSEVEFESGEPVRKLKEAQMARLHAYAGSQTSPSVEVPIERAIDVYLKSQSQTKETK